VPEEVQACAPHDPAVDDDAGDHRLATALCGSGDLYEAEAQAPQARRDHAEAE
jgi:hypothetical protein